MSPNYHLIGRGVSSSIMIELQNIHLAKYISGFCGSEVRMPTKIAIISVCLVIAVVLDDVACRYLECPDGCFTTTDSPCVCPFSSLDKRGVRLPFRYGKRNSFLRYGKRNNFFRYGKRGSIFRYGKRDEDSLSDSSVESNNPYNILQSDYSTQ
ncbi:hypothetical protein LOTGIDRAFT_232424 [Lottia gigantea]|uniref:Uncharacterized protein n=1 Tax=Lottia gigantea TaxID=225164 RepID=V4BYF2_LOTGI|nr:hypothetical protein LOTGIDRAFT_232424 [Lottia gigantea]ESO94159.1 hypothetical protein LOTGIDRAFT_232424 [Lottia gigantea]